MKFFNRKHERLKKMQGGVLADRLHFLKSTVYGSEVRQKLKLIIPSQQRWRGYSNAAVRGWLGE